jgi:hypothetical protein
MAVRENKTGRRKLRIEIKVNLPQKSSDHLMASESLSRTSVEVK